MKNRLIGLLLIMLMLVNTVGCQQSNNKNKNFKYKVVTSIFPYYDAAREIIGDVEEIELQMAVAPGLDSHTFEPTPKDVVGIDEADLFIYNGGTMENWVKEILDSLDSDQIKVEMLKQIDEEHLLLENEDEEIFGQVNEEHEDDSGQVSNQKEIDEHIWTSPVIMLDIVNQTEAALAQMAPEYKQQFKENANQYKKKLESLNKKIANTVDDSKNKMLIFADKFPIAYFSNEYGLQYYAAFPGCSSDMEPSAKTVAFLEDKIDESKVSAIFYLELGSHRVADTISEDTGVKVLEFNSCHTVSQKQFEQGVTYLQLMEKNVESLKTALN